MADQKQVPQILWEVRYKSPNAPTRGVDDVVIGTDVDDEAVAREVAQDYLDHKIPSPSNRLIYVRKFLAHTQAEMRQGKQATAAAVAAEDGRPASAARG